MHDTATVFITAPRDSLDCLAFLNHPLRSGGRLNCRTGISVRRFLEEELRIPTDYVDGAIQTIFLQSSPVDELDTTFVHDGDTLALSAAMPGLAGAVMRRAGTYAPLRAGITYHERGEIRQGDGEIVLKLFNTVLDDLRPLILQRGIRLGAADLRHALGSVNPAACAALTIEFNTKPVSFEMLREDMESLPPDAVVSLTVRVTD